MSDRVYAQKIWELERRSYKKIPAEYQHLVDHIIRRDRIQYFMLQMAEYWDQPPWDLPPSYEDRQYRAWHLDTLPFTTYRDLVGLHELLTGLEAEVVLAAQRRGLRLKRRPCDGDGLPAARNQGNERNRTDGFERG